MDTSRYPFHRLYFSFIGLFRISNILTLSLKGGEAVLRLITDLKTAGAIFMGVANAYCL